MTIPTNARLASRLLQRATRARVSPPTEEARSRAIDAISEAIAQRRRQRRWTRAGLGVLGAAAAVGLFLPGHAREADQPTPNPSARTETAARTEPKLVAHSSSVRLEVTAADRALGAQSQELAAGARVIVPLRSQAVLTFASGSEVTIEEGGEVLLADITDSHVLALERGALRAAVVKLGPKRRFVVRTQDAEVEVHGTSFRVASVTADANCGAGARTRVEVYEGVVSVRARGVEERVPAGDEWPHGCAPTPHANAPDATGARVRHARARPVLSATSAPESKTTSSTLAVENDMFARATAARREGDLTRAVSEFDALLAGFPHGPLAQDAAVQRMKVLNSLDRTRAAEAARDYLARYPQGFARADAQAILRAR